MQNPSVSEIDRFLNYIFVVPYDRGCWLWAGSMGTRGYGQFWSKTLSAVGTCFAHRASWFYFNGAIPDGLCVLHKCDIKLCVNPAHLFLGTEADNSDDCGAKGRRARGQKVGRSKLSDEGVIEIRRLFHSGTKAQELAKRFGVCINSIFNVVRGRNWKHV